MNRRGDSIHPWQTLDRFTAVCFNAGIKISAEKSEILVISKKPVQCYIQVSGTPLRQVEKFKYIGVYFTSDGSLDTEISSRICQAGAVKRELGRCVARKAKLSVFQAVFVPILSYDREIICVMTEGINSRLK